MVKLDFGCGNNKREGFLGVDIIKTKSTDFVLDVRQVPWPWKDNEVEEAHSSHFIEHLTGEEFIVFMNELYRVLKPEGKALLIAPYWTSARAWQDPTHKQLILPEKFMYFNKALRTQLGGVEHCGITADFDFSYGYGISDATWNNKTDERKAFAIRHYFNVVDDLHVTITKRPA